MRVQWLAAAGVLSPLVLVAAMLTVSSQRPDYSPLTQTLSELGAIGRRGAVTMNWLGIIPAGVLIFATAPALGRESVSMWSRAGAVMLAAGGVAFAASALWPWHAGLAGEQRLAANFEHLALALAGFAMIGLAPILFGVGWMPRRPGPGWASIASGLSVLVLAAGQAGGWYIGAFQKSALLVFYAWLVMSCTGILVSGRPKRDDFTS